MNQRLFAWLALPLIALPSAAALDIEGSVDAPGLQRFPGAWIVAYSANDERRGYELVTGRVDRSRRDLRIDSSRRVAAQLMRITYQAPQDARFDEVIAHYRQQVAGKAATIAFQCRGLDCGRSTAWANDVFGVKELVAPDAEQFYLAAAFDDSLAAIYIVQRGNRRVYAHVDLASDATASESEATLADQLRRRGFAVLPMALGAAGQLDGAALLALDEVAAQLTPLAGRTLYVVCHLDGDVESAMQRSQACADQAAKRLQGGAVNVRGFGAGALLPRSGAAARRLELVLPNTRH